MSLNLENPQYAKSTWTRVEELEEQVIEINSKLDAREQEILDLYARVFALEDSNKD